MRQPVLIVNVLIILLISLLNAEEISINKFLNTAGTDPSLDVQKKKHHFIEKTFPGIPLVDDIEFKIQDKGFNINNIEYSVRVSARGFGETRSSGRYLKAMLKRSAHKADLLKEAALKNRYLLVIDLLEQNAMHSIYSELITLYADKVKVLEKMSSSSEEFEINDIIEAENDFTKTQAADMEFQKLAELYSLKATEYLKDSSFSGFDTTGMIPIDTLINIIEKSSYQLDTNNVYLSNLRYDLQIEEARYNLERAESRRYLSYIGFGFDKGEYLDQVEKKNEDKYYNLKDGYTFELGVKVPILTTQGHDVVKRKVDFLKASEEYDLIKSELTDLLNEDIKDLKYYIVQYRYLKAREQEVDAESSLKKYLQLTGIDPLKLLEIKESIIKNKINTINVIYGIYRNYIQIIDVTGELSKCPDKNYLLLK